ncbi:hypothetical protein [Pectobacterium odoriferum]|uniref:hypothetical protein n=1 Tax=Pectobacterium odoriferum TaxID=78398 RepID=UPI000CD05DCC|nr:hypothetical protein [Pectobacterium odoriferum]POE40256.1 hypothetical protein BV920_08850 [Pectobacterium odoriferum]
MEVGSWADVGSFICNTVMAGAALYAAYNAKGWLDQEHYNNIKKFRIIMNDVDSKLLNYVLAGSGGALEHALALPSFLEADNYINVICISLSKENEDRLRTEYYKFKNDHIDYWIDLRDNSSDGDYVSKYHPTFYYYLSKKMWVKN